MQRLEAVRRASEAICKVYPIQDALCRSGHEIVAVLEELGLIRFDGPPADPLASWMGPPIRWSSMGRPAGHETQGSGYDPGATAHELQGRAKAPPTPAEVLARVSLGPTNDSDLSRWHVGSGPYGADAIIDALTIAGYKIVKS